MKCYVSVQVTYLLDNQSFCINHSIHIKYKGVIYINPFSTKPYIIITTGRAPSLSAVTETFYVIEQIFFFFFFFGKRLNFFLEPWKYVKGYVKCEIL